MKKKLEKLKMPEKRPSDMEMSLDDMQSEESSESPEEEASESPEYEQAEGDMEKPQPSLLDSVEDDELMAEVKKRGLLGELEGGEEQAQEDSEMDFSMGK